MCGLTYAVVRRYRVSEAAELLGVSSDTVRRWTDTGRLQVTKGPGGRRLIEGSDLANFAQTLARSPSPPTIQSESARNRFTGIVTKVQKDAVMAQVEILAGRHRVVSLMSREAADELGLEPGVLAVASIKATSVVVEVAQ
jgi:molybdopterin-binding protein